MDNQPPSISTPIFLHLAPPALIAWMSVTLRGVSDLIFNSSKAAVSWPLSSASTGCHGIAIDLWIDLIEMLKDAGAIHNSLT